MHIYIYIYIYSKYSIVCALLVGLLSLQLIVTAMPAMLCYARPWAQISTVCLHACMLLLLSCMFACPILQTLARWDWFELLICSVASPCCCSHRSHMCKRVHSSWSSSTLLQSALLLLSQRARSDSPGMWLGKESQSKAKIWNPFWLNTFGSNDTELVES